MGERRTEITGNGDDRRRPYGLVKDELVDGEVLRPRGDVQQLRVVQGKIQAGVEGEGRSGLAGIGDYRRQQWRDGELGHGQPGGSFLGLLGSIDKGGRGLFIGGTAH